ncbi:MAG: ATP-binding cassette domain-containing protein [Lachnospiraceae bacterium]
MKLEVCVKKQLKEFVISCEFSVTEGTLGIMGPSGSGKSMLLKCIAGIERPDEGQIVLDGCVLFDSAKNICLPPQRRNVGYLFQNYALFPNMTVRQNILCGLQAGKLSKKHCEEKAAEMMKRFRLDNLENRYPGQLSGGQKQRVALARLLATEPGLILLDEPFSALDEELKEELLQELKELRSSYGGLSILVSHDSREIEKLSSRLCRIRKGELKNEEP